jgi:multidrug resistance protein, MATE family
MTEGLRFGESVGALFRQSWPLWVGQVAVLGFATIDTFLLARHGAQSLAAFAVGSAAYIVCFIGLMGVVMAVAPIAARLYGAGQHAQAGRQVHQAVWVALGVCLPGCALLLFPQPFLSLSQASPELSQSVRGYLLLLAMSLPASMLFTVFRAFNNAISRPQAVMAVQLGGLALKLPLSAALIFGVPSLGIPELGVQGAAASTALCMWTQALIGHQVLRRDAHYTRFELFGRGLDRPDKASLLAQLKLGLPMGGSIVAEVAGFAFMAIFIARLGASALAAHQISMNFASLLFMAPIALASGGMALVAQRLGAGEHDAARVLARHTLALALIIAATAGLLSSLLRGPIVAMYTQDAAVTAVALQVLALFWIFHVADAAQIVCAFLLRAWHVTLASLLIYLGGLWGVGLGLGYALAFNLGGQVPAGLQGVLGYWVAATLGIWITALGLAGWLWRISARQAVPGRDPAAAA